MAEYSMSPVLKSFSFYFHQGALCAVHRQQASIRFLLLFWTIQICSPWHLCMHRGHLEFPDVAHPWWETPCNRVCVCSWCNVYSVAAGCVIKGNTTRLGIPNYHSHSSNSAQITFLSRQGQPWGTWQHNPTANGNISASFYSRYTSNSIAAY